MATTTIPILSNPVPRDFVTKDVGTILGRGAVREKPGMIHRRTISKILLESAELPKGGSMAARAIWMTEAKHRAMSLLHLILLMNSGQSRIHRSTYISAETYEMAKKLTDVYRSLEFYDRTRIGSSEETLQNIVYGLLAVFRGACEVEVLAVQTRSFFLRVEQRRAIALLISELITAMLRDASERAVSSRLIVACTRIRNEGINIKVETSCPLSRSFESPGHDVVCALSGVLDAEILYSEPRIGGTDVKIFIPFEKI